jgi:ATP phosphoribosyltransferase regulatory subunit
MKTLTQIPLGTQLLFGKAAKKRRRIERTIFSVFERWNYDEIIPPIFDYYDVFAKGMGAAFEDTLYRFIDREGNILALRPEFTSLVAKSVATRLADHPKPLRLCYCGEVLRYEAPRGGRQREFSKSASNTSEESHQSDAEIILVASISQELGIRRFRINLERWATSPHRRAVEFLARHLSRSRPWLFERHCRAAPGTRTPGAL